MLPMHEGTGFFCFVWVELQSLNMSRSIAAGTWPWWVLVSGAPEPASGAFQLPSLQLFENCYDNLYSRQQEGPAGSMQLDRIGFFPLFHFWELV